MTDSRSATLWIVGTVEFDAPVELWEANVEVRMGVITVTWLPLVTDSSDTFAVFLDPCNLRGDIIVTD